MPNLHDMSQGASVHLVGQEPQEGFEIRRIEFRGRHELPIDGTQLVLQFHDAAREKSGNGAARLAENCPIGRKSGRLQGEDETVGRFIAPFGEGLRFLRAVKGAVDFDRREMTAGVFKLAFLQPLVGIKRAAPGFVGPTADTDSNGPFHSDGLLIVGAIDGDRKVIVGPLRDTPQQTARCAMGDP